MDNQYFTLDKLVIPHPDNNSDPYIHGFYPYTSMAPFYVIQNLEVDVPFKKIVNRSMGQSTCTKCGATYKGSRDRCDSVVEAGYFIYSKQGFKFYLKKTNAIKAQKRYISNEMYTIYKPCKSLCDWDLKEPFELQRNFFESFGRLAEVTSRVIDEYQNRNLRNVVQYEKCFRSGERIASIIEIEKLKDEILEIKQALRMAPEENDE